MENNRPISFQIYSILKKYSSEDRPMNAADIMIKMSSEWNLPKPPTRKTVYTHLQELQQLSDLGMLDCEIMANKGASRTMGYFTRPALTKAEVKLLCDAIASSRFISKTYSKDLIRKLGDTYGDDFVAKYSYILELKDPGGKDYNPALFDSIELVSEAIENNKKVTFQYLKYDLDKSLVPKYKENGGFLTVNPYYLIWTLNHYYIFCEMEETGERRFLRMDKIREAATLEQAVKPLPSDFNLRDYTRNQAFMFGGETERVKLRCQTRMLGQVIDFFGEDAEIVPIDDDYFEVQIVTSIESIKYWVLQYITAIDDIRPEKLRGIIVGYLEDAVRRNK